ncbi:flavin reductase family protein [Sulfitobacter sp. 20_GPM-1509m]|uniref:flavin reductase family protein n=1 Tax=Sulfitobacter sp. 20_GPM-1509m TaxID=1380367 RepID=UPI00048A86E4|nr:flavin reductase family protein [Sulfitobacter sp. 20_GPM-1509m]
MLDQQQFKKIASHWASGVAIVSAAGGAEGASGLTITSVTSLSLDPPQYLICLDQKSATLAAIRESGMFCINYLKHTQQAVSRVFATKNPEKLEQLTGQTARGVPCVEDALAIIECEVDTIHAGGDHAIIIGNVLSAESEGGDPLVYFRGGYRELTQAI